MYFAIKYSGHLASSKIAPGHHHLQRFRYYMLCKYTKKKCGKPQAACEDLSNSKAVLIVIPFLLSLLTRGCWVAVPVPFALVNEPVVDLL